MLDLIEKLLELVKEFGYLGIFIMTFIESTFIPIPAEITMIPAGYLAAKGEMNLFIIMIVSVIGTVCGALLNYWIAYHYGRNLIVSYGKYFFMNETKINNMEAYFAHHGSISTFTGRLIPGLRHYISFPAGLARMDLTKFCIYTALGGGIWMFILMMLGYLIGENEHLVKSYIANIQVGLFIFLILLSAWYIIKYKKEKNN
jgi:membrane protein DedA with SNARE-associated domain